MWWPRKVRRANIPSELRDRFELFGVEVLAHAVGAGVLSSKGAELDALLQQKRDEIVAWLRERRDIAENDATLGRLLEVAILVFVIVGVVFDAALVAR
jgi:hypothetical protein